MRFNPPPNWPPAPPGWTPPPGWQPDPSWPPLPPGWQLWVEDRSGASQGGLIIGATGRHAVRRRRRRGRGRRHAADARHHRERRDAPPPHGSMTDEEQIEAVVERFQSAWNEHRLRGVRAHRVRGNAQRRRVQRERLPRSERRFARTWTSRSVAVEVDGDSATATVKQAAKTPMTSRSSARTANGSGAKSDRPASAVVQLLPGIESTATHVHLRDGRLPDAHQQREKCLFPG